MLEVTVNINRQKIVAQLHAVRTNPKTKTVKEGTICKYNIVYNNIVVDFIEGKYGCGVDLAIELLKRYKTSATRYKVISMQIMIEKENNVQKKLP